MVNTRKFSQFAAGGDVASGDDLAGLRAGVNTIFDYVESGGGGNVIKLVDSDTTVLQVGRWVRRTTGGAYVHGLADTPENAEIVGVVLSIVSPTQFLLQQAGYIDHGTPGFTGFSTGRVYFLSEVTPGLMQLLPPTANGMVKKALFIAESNDSGWVVCLEAGMVIGTPAPIPATPAATDSNFRDVNQPGNTFGVGDWVRVSGESVYSLADGKSLANAQAAGVVVANGDPNFRIQSGGWNFNSVVGAVNQAGAPIALVPGTAYYLSDVVGAEGKITPFPPTAPGSATKPVFISESAINFSGLILPQRPLPVTQNNQSIITVNQIAHGFQRGNVVRVSAANTYALAQANTFAGSLGVGFVIERIDADNFILQTNGLSAQFFAPFAPLVPNNLYYLSDAVLGGITNVAPVAATSFVKPMLIALNTTTGFILEQASLPVAGPVAPGSILQLLQTVKSDTFRTALAGWQTVPGLSVVITPTTLGSRLKVYLSLNLASDGSNGVAFKIQRNGADINVGNAAGLRTQAGGTSFGTIPAVDSGIMVSKIFVDMPASLLPQTYTVQVFRGNSAEVMVNESISASNAANLYRTSSNLIVEEIA